MIIGSHGATLPLPMATPLVRSAVTVTPTPVAVASGGHVCARAWWAAPTSSEIIIAPKKLLRAQSDRVFVSIQLFPIKKFIALKTSMKDREHPCINGQRIQ